MEFDPTPPPLPGIKKKIQILGGGFLFFWEDFGVFWGFLTHPGNENSKKIRIFWGEKKSGKNRKWEKKKWAGFGEEEPKHGKKPQKKAKIKFKIANGNSQISVNLEFFFIPH